MKKTNLTDIELMDVIFDSLLLIQNIKFKKYGTTFKKFAYPLDFKKLNIKNTPDDTFMECIDVNNYKINIYERCIPWCSIYVNKKTKVKKLAIEKTIDVDEAIQYISENFDNDFFTSPNSYVLTLDDKKTISILLEYKKQRNNEMMNDSFDFDFEPDEFYDLN